MQLKVTGVSSRELVEAAVATLPGASIEVIPEGKDD